MNGPDSKVQQLVQDLLGVQPSVQLLSVSVYADEILMDRLRESGFDDMVLHEYQGQVMDALSCFLMQRPVPTAAEIEENPSLADFRSGLSASVAMWEPGMQLHNVYDPPTPANMGLGEQLAFIFRVDVGALPSPALLEQTIYLDSTLMDDARDYGFLNPNVRERTIDAVAYALIGDAMPDKSKTTYRRMQQVLADRVRSFGR